MNRLSPSATPDLNAGPDAPPGMGHSSNQPDTQDHRKWYVIRTEPQGDYQAAWELQRAGYEIFSPRVKSVRTTRDSRYVPLFPGYLFLKWDLEARGKPSFQEAPHVSGWVNFGGTTPTVPDAVVAELDHRVSELNRRGGLWRKFKPGDKVRVVANHLNGLAEVIEEPRSPRCQVRVLMQFMGRLVPTQVPWEKLWPVEEGQKTVSRSPRRTRGRGRWVRGFGPRAAEGF